MRPFIDDGSTNIKMLWTQDGKEFTHISPNSFKRGWSAMLGAGQAFNYTIGNEKYSSDLVSPDALATDNVNWQYSSANAVAIQHALQTSCLEPQPVDIVVTLPLSEFFDSDSQPRLDNINRKKESVQQSVQVNKGEAFTINRVTVRPESIPAGIHLCDQLSPTQSLVIVDIGGTTLDISQATGGMAGISRIYGDPKLGVSLVTNTVLQALRQANMESSRYRVDQLIIHRDNDNYLKDNINDPDAIELVKATIASSIEQFQTRVLEAVSVFSGYTHMTVIGGGAPLLADAIRERVNIPQDRFFVEWDPQFALVRGLKALG